MYTVTYRETERAAFALLTANEDKDCEFTRYLKHLLAQPNVEKYMRSQKYLDAKLSIDQAQCDHQAFRLLCLKSLPTSAALISQVNFILFQS